jgi:hypothetical protein
MAIDGPAQMENLECFVLLVTVNFDGLQDVEQIEGCRRHGTSRGRGCGSEGRSLIPRGGDFKRRLMAPPGRRTIKGFTAKFAKKYRKGRKTDNHP